MVYPQGRTFPPSAHGFGLIFAVIGILLWYLHPDQYFSLLLIYPSLWILFSKTRLDTTHSDRGILLKRYGFFPLFFTRQINLRNYDAGIIKHERVKYRNIHSIGFIVINVTESSDSFFALNLKLKKSLETETVFKGSLQEIASFIKTHLGRSTLRYFKGAVHKDQEIFFDPPFSSKSVTIQE